MNNAINHGDRIAKAAAAVRDAETRNMSKSTIARRYKAYFAAEDAAKAACGGWS